MAFEEPCKIMEDFLSPEKCQYLIDTYKDNCKRSTVVDNKGKDVVDGGRTSTTYFLPENDPVVKELRTRAARMSGEPESHVEGLQLVRYAKGEQYRFHYDYYDAIAHNQRKHTFLVYLNDLDLNEGGATIFKEYKIRVSPHTGRCVWFRNTHDDGSLNTKSLHSGEEVKSDKVKYAINIWIRQKPVEEDGDQGNQGSKGNRGRGSGRDSGSNSNADGNRGSDSWLFGVLLFLLLLTVTVIVLFVWKPTGLVRGVTKRLRGAGWA